MVCSPENVLALFSNVRKQTEWLCEPLETEDYVIQSMHDVSPTRWHLAHTTWFFETFLLKEFQAAFRPYHEQFHYLFNSYYNSLGDQHCRDRRGILSRPTVAQIYDYRHFIDAAIHALFNIADEKLLEIMTPRMILGLNHEQQHQELILMDIKHVFFSNPLKPQYRDLPTTSQVPINALEYTSFPEGIYSVGAGGSSFFFDNEAPRHRVFLEPFEIGNRAITCGEFLLFIEDNGYLQPTLWLSEGWNAVKREGWSAPLYWEYCDGEWMIFTLGGMRKLNRSEPVCHLSYFEADAYARWAGARLPTEQEWEVAASKLPPQGNFVENGYLHPQPAGENGSSSQQFFGDVWEWTQSPYTPYPGFRAGPGALGEYNGKFMCNQVVLRGGACVTPATHIRSTYRNFFYPASRWVVSGVRLGRNK